MSTQLPVAGLDRVRAQTRLLLRRHRGLFVATALLHVLAALASLAAPALLGQMVDRITDHTLTVPQLNWAVLFLAVALAAQASLTGVGEWSSLVLGERVMAQIRETFAEEVSALPLSVVEQAGSGDLVSRTTTDVDAVRHTMQHSMPAEIRCCVSIAVTLTAMLLTGPLIAAAGLVVLPVLYAAMRWYLHRAAAGYREEAAAAAAVNGMIAETVDAAATVRGMSLQEYRRASIQTGQARSYRAERYTLWLRSVWIPMLEGSYVVMVAVILAWGGWLTLHGHASAGQVTTVTLYAAQITYPLDEMLSRLDEFQVGATSLARILGVGEVPLDREAGTRQPDSDQIEAQQVRYAYREGRDVLHGIDVQLQPGERLAIVGPSGAGKSTLGRLLAGIHPPTSGRVTTGSSNPVPLVELPLDDLRQRVSLVTQENHLFVGTVAQNLRLAQADASDEEMLRALDCVDAAEWVMGLPNGLDTVIGSGGYAVPPSRAQQLALARLVLADPHTLVLDEATSLLDPRAARHLERSMSAVLAGRTVVAIAHRLNTAHDADRVAVVEDGRITELGTHAELIGRDGSYAALWRAWRHDSLDDLAQL